MKAAVWLRSLTGQKAGGRAPVGAAVPTAAHALEISSRLSQTRQKLGESPTTNH